MVKLYNSKGRPFFLYPDTGGGSSTSGATGQTSSGDKVDGGEDFGKLFDSLPWDELDDASRAKFEDFKKKSLATLQEVPKLKSELETQGKLARSFQSEADRLKAEKAKETKPAEKDPYLETVIDVLKTSGGYNEADAIKLAPVFAEMFKRTGVIQKKEIGADLAPMGASVLEQNARNAFIEAEQSETDLGIFDEPTVKQEVWNLLQERIKAGVPTDKGVVLSLGKMVWADHVATQRREGKEITFKGTKATTPTGTNMNTGGFNFPGASSISPIISPTRDANAPKHALDTDTARAIKETFGAMTKGLELKTLPQDIKTLLTPTRRGR